MEAIKKFLLGSDAQLNSEQIVTFRIGKNELSIEEKDTCKNIEGLFGSQDDAESISCKLKELLLERLTILKEHQLMVLCWENPYSLHTFCQGLRADETVDACPLSYVQMKQLLADVVSLAAQKEGEADYWQRWYYPYPSLSFTTHMFSEERLPRPMECEDNFAPTKKATLECFDERAAIDEMVKAGMYPQMANAYMVVLTRDGDRIKKLANYCRFSVQRRTDKQIMTLLYRDHVKKCAYTDSANMHVQKMMDYEGRLSKQFATKKILDKPLRINEALKVQDDKAVTFAFVNGDSLEEILDHKLAQAFHDNAFRGEVVAVLLSVCQMLRGLATCVFEVTEGFEQIFGRDALEVEDPLTRNGCLEITDLDFVCQNLLVDRQQVTLIDYEWSFVFPIPVDFVIYRFLYLYLEGKDRETFSKEDLQKIYEQAGISEEMRKTCEMLETQFQRYVQKDAFVRRNEFEEKSKPVLGVATLHRQLEQLDEKALVVSGQKDDTQVVYLPKASGQVMRYILDANSLKNRGNLSLTCKGYAPNVMLRIGMLLEDEKGLSVADKAVAFTCNGKGIGGLVYAFTDTVELSVLEEIFESKTCSRQTKLLISIEELISSADAKKEITTQISDLEFLVDNRQQQLKQMQESMSWKVTAPLRKLKK